MQTSQLLITLSDRLAALAVQIEAVDNQQAAQPRFAHTLFQTRGARLADYLAESRLTLQQLTQSAEQGNAERVAWLAQRLIDQITALARELATLDLRRAQPARAEPKDNYARLDEHQDYERRLIAMIRDRESLRSNAGDGPRQQQLQQEIAALEGRLSRCRQALRRIERQIERRETGLETD